MFSSSFEYVPPPPPKRKRGVTHPEKYARSVIKKSRVKGEGYINYKGKMVPPKTLPTKITCSCPRKCHKNVTDDAKNTIWTNFYNLENKNIQDIYLQTLIEVKDVGRRRKKKKKDVSEPERSDTPPPDDNVNNSSSSDANVNNAPLPEANVNNTQFPSASLNNTPFNVNNTQFMGANVNNSPFSNVNNNPFHGTIGNNNQFPNANVNSTQFPDPNSNRSQFPDTSNVNKSKANVKKKPPNKHKERTFVYNIKVRGRFTQVCKNVFLQVHGVSKDRIERMCKLLIQNKTPVDMRGKNRSGNAIPSNIIYLIHDHISRFEVKETSGSGKPKKYLDARLNISKMYQMFQTTYPDLKDKVKYSFYYKYYKEHFNYPFGLPQGEGCSKCENAASKPKDPVPNNHVVNAVKSSVSAVPTEMVYNPARFLPQY